MTIVTADPKSTFPTFHKNITMIKKMRTTMTMIIIMIEVKLRFLLKFMIFFQVD